MKARIVRMVNRSMHKDPTCVICGEAKRKNKSLFVAELSCSYQAEVRICRTCSGEEGAMREDTIELPYMDEAHWHIEGTKSKTFFDFSDTLRWMKEFMQLPEPVQVLPGRFQITLPELVMTMFRCTGDKVTESGK